MEAFSTLLHKKMTAKMVKILEKWLYTKIIVDFMQCLCIIDSVTYNELLKASDEELCLLLQQGRSAAEEILAARYLSLVRACARPYFLAGGSAEDLTQEGMLGLIAAMREFKLERGALFRSFAERCVKNRIYSGVRAANREKHLPLNTYVSIDPLSSHADLLPQQSSPSPEQQLLDRERFAEIREQLRGLLSEFEDKILGLYLEGLTTAEIAARLGRERKSVENAVQRVRQKVAGYLNSGENGR